jgi:tRNA dimethylallyltransferase
MPYQKPKVIIITGPTAVGKSSLGHRLAVTLGGEIINADSMQVYRYMDIGTAKPGPEERAEVPYHLIDIRDPHQPFQAADFRNLALETITTLADERKPILVIGGTGLYLRVLQRGLFPCPASKPELRQKWAERAEGQGEHFLWSAVQERDPAAAARIHPRDRVRLIRALEVLELTGRPWSEWQQWDRRLEDSADFLWVGLRLERAALYGRINRRTDEMMARGFLEEVQGLLQKGYGPDLHPLKSLGYRHLARVVRGEWPLPQAVELLKRDTRRYAKRQMTWLAKEPDLNWFLPDEFDNIKKLCVDFLQG